METEALESKVGENYHSYKIETWGKVWKPKSKCQTTPTILPHDLGEALDGASVEELAELAGKTTALMLYNRLPFYYKHVLRCHYFDVNH